jgi:hypothetical protein
LKQAGVRRWTLNGLNPNRIKRLAQVARRSTNQALLRTPDERRYPIPGVLIFPKFRQIGRRQEFANSIAYYGIPTTP